jgi:hypothetical protein
VNRIEINVGTGEQVTIELTPEEESAVYARAAVADKPKAKTLVDQILDDPVELAKLKAALGL